MSIVAISSPAGNRPFTGRDIGAANGARLLNRASRDNEPANPARKLSLNALLQSESLNLIKENLNELSRFADQFPSFLGGQDACPINEKQLLAMIRRSRDISNSLDRIGSLREQEVPLGATSYIPVRPLSLLERKRRQERIHRKKAHKCHKCKAVKTPVWRNGPDGPRSLCNFCGLVYSKRQKRYAQQVARAAKEAK